MSKAPVRAKSSASPPSEVAAGEVRGFVRVEKNLSTMGFFTPSKSRSQGELREKVIRFKREMGGKMMIAEASIIPSVTLGLPTTADQDKYLAFQKIVNDRRTKQGGMISNPVSFTSSELLAILGVGQAGKNYSEVYEWLERMAATTIRSQGVVFLAKRKLYARDIFHVFDRVVVMGGELPDGRVADSNYVWLSSWQLENINQNYLLPVDFETYRGLRNNIAKALVPLLQLWLYASRANGIFEKRYDDLCELLSLCPQRYGSDIQKQLGPSLEELQAKGFLASWRVESTNDGGGFKIRACHGPKFFRDQQPQGAAPWRVIDDDHSPPLLAALLKRNVAEPQARRLLRALPANQPVSEQIEYIDSIVGRGRIENPPGLYVSMLRSNIPIPDNFESTARKQAREMREQDRTERQMLDFREGFRYEEYLRGEVDRYIREVLGEAGYQALMREKLPKARKTYPKVPQATLLEIAESAVRIDIRDGLPVMTFEEFKSGGSQPRLF